MQQRYADAIELFEASLKLEPGDAVTHKNLGLALAQLGRRDEATIRFREALRLNPDMIEAQQALRELSRQ